jgi:uncharacterized membrane protein
MSGWIELLMRWIEAGGIAIIATGAVVATVIFLQGAAARRVPFDELYGLYRRRLGQAILLGLELLVAADIIGTVAVEPTFESVGVLGLIVLVRTFLSMALEVEMEGRLPWRRQQS